MSSAMENKRIPSDAELSAPWHITGTLAEDEARTLEQLAKDDPEFAKLLADATLEAEAAIALNNALPGPSPEIWTKLEASIAAQPKQSLTSRIRDWAWNAKSKISERYTIGSVSLWQVAGVAAVVVCVIQAGAIAYLVKQGSDQPYTVASGPKELTRTPQTLFLITFSPTATVAEIGKVLNEVGATIVDGPVSGTLYRITIKNDTVAEKDAALNKLRASPFVKMALPQKQ